MALARWDELNGLLPREGHAVFDTSSGWHHAMICSAPGSVSVQGGEKIQVIHMGPPLGQGTPEITTPGKDHWLGSFAELGTETLEAIHREALGLVNKAAPSAKLYLNYDFSLHGISQSEPNSQDQVVIRAGCSSLLEHCYEVNGVDLVKEEAVPKVANRENLAELVSRSLTEVDNLIRHMGKDVPWPCPVLFPAYQMRAFEAGFAELPYQPQLSDHPYTRPGAKEKTASPSGTEEDADLE